MNVERPRIRLRIGSSVFLIAGAGLVLALVVLARPGGAPLSGASPSPSESLGAQPSSLPLPTAGVAVGRTFAAELGSVGFAVAKIGGPSLRLPPGELLLALSSDRVASVQYLGTTGSILVIREITSGRQLVALKRPESIDTAVFAGGSLYFTGPMPDGSDSGVSAIALSDSVAREIITPTTWPAEWNGTGTRNQLRVSPTGATVGSPACGPAGQGGPKRCFIDVIDAVSGTVTRPVTDTPLNLWDVSDATLFAVPEERNFVTAFDRKTGAQRWQAKSDEFVEHYPTSDGTAYVVTYVSVGNGGDIPTFFVLAAIDTTNGAIRVIHEEADGGRPMSLWPELSDDRFAVVGRVNARLIGAFGNGAASLSADLVDLATGQVVPDGLNIPSPAGR